MSGNALKGAFVLQTASESKPTQMNGRKPARSNRRAVILGWSVAIAGMTLWTYGLFAGSVPPVLDWQSFSPVWMAEMVPTRIAEVGLVLSFAGMVPIYYAQFRQRRRGHVPGRGAKSPTSV